MCDFDFYMADSCVFQTSPVKMDVNLSVSTLSSKPSFSRSLLHSCIYFSISVAPTESEKLVDKYLSGLRKSIHRRLLAGASLSRARLEYPGGNGCRPGRFRNLPEQATLAEGWHIGIGKGWEELIG